MIRNAFSLSLVLLCCLVADAGQRWYRTADGFVMGGRKYVLGVDDYCCGKSSCSMQRDLWAAFAAAQRATSEQQAVAALQTAKTSFAPTPNDAVNALWKVIQPSAGQMVIDPGCGDARILIDAAKRFGAKGVGIEINPDTATKAINAVSTAGLDSHISIARGDCRSSTFANADYVVVYLYDDLIKELVPKFQRMKFGAIVVSYEHRLPMAGTITVRVGQHRFYVWTKR
jgi:SAM-dependent methyltransferase